MEADPHSIPEMDYSACRFFIRRLNTYDRNKPVQMPQATLPLVGFLYVTSGEVLVEIGGTPYLCQTGHALIIPAKHPFSIRYYNDAAGYSGAFSTSLLSDTRPLRFLTEPIHQAFWFDEGVFMGELFNMIQLSFEKGDNLFIEKALDLFLSRLRSGKPVAVSDIVNRFLESIFNPDRSIGTISSYAAQAGISDNYLSRKVKQGTGRSVGDWIDAVRIVRAKKLLADTSLPVIDVATAVGLADQSYFARFFKRETGQTPSEYRKVMQG